MFGAPKSHTIINDISTETDRANEVLRFKKLHAQHKNAIQVQYKNLVKSSTSSTPLTHWSDFSNDNIDVVAFLYVRPIDDEPHIDIIKPTFVSLQLPSLWLLFVLDQHSLSISIKTHRIQ